MRRFKLLAEALIAVVAVVVSAASAGAAAPVGSVQFRTVDVPASVCAQPCFSPPVFTQVSGVNNAGTLVGVWNGAAGDQHGFIEQPGGQPVSFDALGLPCCTAVQAINDAGTVVGSVCTCQGSTFLFHGWVRSRDGSFTELDDPLAPDQTYPTGINDSGVIVGEYVDASGNTHGFIDNRGKFTNLDFPGASATYVSGINNSGAIVGEYFDALGSGHGFVYQNGKFTEIDAPGAGAPAGFCGEGTGVSGISAGGQIVGDVCSDVGLFGWALSRGQFLFPPDPSAAPDRTFLGGISENGRMVGGFYFDTSGVGHGLVATLTP